MNLLYKLSDHPHSRWLTHAIGLSLLLLGTLPIYFFSFQPAVEKEETNRALALDIQSELNDAGKLRNEFRLLTNTLAEATGRLNELPEIPTTPLDTQFLGQVSAVADDLGIKIQDFQPGAVSHTELFSTLKITLRFEASYGDTCQFFQRVSELPCLSRLERLEILSDGVQEKYPVTVEFNLCFRPEENSITNDVALR